MPARSFPVSVLQNSVKVSLLLLLEQSGESLLLLLEKSGESFEFVGDLTYTSLLFTLLFQRLLTNHPKASGQTQEEHLPK